MTLNIIRALCIAAVFAACADSSPSLTDSPTSGPKALPRPTTSELVGTLAFVSTREGAPHIYLSNPDGSGVRRLTNSLEAEVTPAWSRDGRQLAFRSDSSTYVINRDGSGLLRLPIGGSWPSWSPDGKKLLVATSHGLRIVAADGSTGSEVSVELKRDPGGSFGGYDVDGASAANWSPDGQRIAFSAWTGGYDFYRAYVVNVDGSGGRAFVGVLNHVIWDECGAVWSPDGRRIALLGGVFGGIGIFAVGIVDPETGEITPILVTGTTCWDATSYENSYSGVAWSPDGTTLAITRRSPSWESEPYWTGPKEASIAIVDIATKVVRAVIPDAYDPAWSGVP